MNEFVALAGSCSRRVIASSGVAYRPSFLYNTILTFVIELYQLTVK